MKLQGKCAIISGATQGLGYEIAKEYVKQGANLMLCARDEKMLLQAKENLGESQIAIQQTDISKPDEVKALVAATLKCFGKIDILVANAAIYGPKGPIEEVDWQEWSDAIDINLKGTVLQCIEVLTHFKQNRAGKIIILSGGGATKPLPFLSAYAASKAGVVRFAETLAEEVGSFGIDVNAVAPGAMNTRLLDEILTAGPEKVGKVCYEAALVQKKEGGSPFSLAVALCLFLATAASDGIRGKLISAVWDAWNMLPANLSALQSSDIYTLRRIIPADRQKVWE